MPIVKPGASTTVAWSNIQSPAATDWIGLYPSSGAPDSGFVGWEYVSCTQTPGSAGSPAGQCAFQVPQSMGTTYEFRLFAANGFTRLAKSDAFAVRPVMTNLSAPASLRTGDALQVTWSGLDPASATDWLVCIQLEHQIRAAYLSSCTKAAGASGTANGNCTFTAPAPGNYEVRVFAANGFISLGTVQVTISVN